MPRTPGRSATPAQRTVNWDLIRVIAVLGVIVGHITYRGVRNHPELAGYPFEFGAQFGAATLLAVSGYFVCVTIRKGDRATWYRSRLARILPAYLVAAAVTYVLTRYAVLSFNGWQAEPGLFGALFGDPVRPQTVEAAGPADWYLPGTSDLLANLTLTFGWSSELRMLDGSYWTLPVQVMAFTAAAVLWPTRWRGGKHITALMWGLLVLPFVARLVFLLREVYLGAVTTGYSATGLWRAYLFAIGVAIWLWSRDRISTAQLSGLATCAVGAHALDSEHNLTSALGYAVMLCLICAAAKGPDWDTPLLTALRRPIAWLAGISFGVYLVHQHLGYLLARVLVDAGVPAVPRMVLITVAAVVAGWLLTELVERPAHRFLTGGRRQRATARSWQKTPEQELDDLVKELPGKPRPVSVGGAS